MTQTGELPRVRVDTHSMTGSIIALEHMRRCRRIVDVDAVGVVESVLS